MKRPSPLPDERHECYDLGYVTAWNKAGEVFLALLTEWEECRDSLDGEFSGDFDASDRERAKDKAEWLHKWREAQVNP